MLRRRVAPPPVIIHFALTALCAAVATGCTTENNPRSCADGYCEDPSLPFCDVDGTIGGGQRLTCIAVDCTPLEFAACRGDEALICSASGDNYDITHCEHGCEVASRGCRGCRDDNECESQVCDVDTGDCAAQNSVVYAHPLGSPSPGCGTLAVPCSVEAAFTTASPSRNIIKLAPGEYTALQTLSLMNTQTGFIHGFGATLTGNIDIKDGQDVTIRGLSVVNPSAIGYGIDCYTSGQLPPSLKLDRTFIKSAYIGLQAYACDVVVQRSVFYITDSQSGFGIVLLGIPGGAIAEATIHRSSFQGPTGILASNGARAHCTNCVFQNDINSIILLRQGDTLPGAGDIAFSTFVDSPILCGDGPVVMQLSNNIIFGTYSGVFADGTRCSHHFSLITPAIVVPPGDHIFKNLNPQFVDVAAGDFHLATGSPAIDMADPTVGVSEDFEGTSRPQGPARDLGAYEFVPR